MDREQLTKLEPLVITYSRQSYGFLLGHISYIIEDLKQADCNALAYEQLIPSACYLNLAALYNRLFQSKWNNGQKTKRVSYQPIDIVLLKIALPQYRQYFPETLCGRYVISELLLELGKI